MHHWQNIELTGNVTQLLHKACAWEDDSWEHDSNTAKTRTVTCKINLCEQFAALEGPYLLRLFLSFCSSLSLPHSIFTCRISASRHALK